ncbi:hypothetical protein QVD17_01090 [Tagetes erecta]|uniref:Uncharacterized protein n=1 Tax=Tagetes erecta TaxID=13708 RepID=A0AAD8L4D1_TARER|nr:hypothetical protein QVD17_01090 [Tagetes erecta]
MLSDEFVHLLEAGKCKKIRALALFYQFCTCFDALKTQLTLCLYSNLEYTFGLKLDFCVRNLPSAKGHKASFGKTFHK